MAAQAWNDPLRPLRVFAPVMAVAGPVFLVAAVVLAVLALSAERTVVATAEGSRLVLSADQVAGSPALKVYALIPDGGRRATETCELETGGAATADEKLYGGDTFTVAGQPLRQVADISSGWADGDAFSCPRATRMAALTGAGLVGRLVPAVLALLVGLGATTIGVAGLRMRRRDRKPGEH